MKCLKMLVTMMLMCGVMGCGGLQPIKNQVSSVSATGVTYVFSAPTSVADLQFGDYMKSRRGDGYVENSGIKATKGEATLRITKFVDNGIAGSVNEYTVGVDARDREIVLTPVENRIHQDGLFIPKPVPSFDLQQLKEFLSNTRHQFTFEVDSQYSSESVNANFKRLLSQRSLSQFGGSEDKIFENTYFLSVPGAESRIDVKTYPYRNGSKCTVTVVYFTHYQQNDRIVLPDIEKSIVAKVREIVNS